ncbi:MAG: choice-of-anchor B family protein [Sphingobacteriales bacterium]|nr:MAG: choice-of-anchor B family protein [Sphingobacteriales bacterium]
MRIILVLIFSLLAFRKADAQQSSNIQLRCHWFDTTGLTTPIGQLFNDVWGFTANGIEYGVIGSHKGAHIIRVDDCQQVASYPGRSGSGFVFHRDYKTYGHYLYAVADEGLATLQIFDLNYLPDSLHLVYESSPDTPLLAHTLFIDTATSRLYLASAKAPRLGRVDFLQVYSLANPEKPALTHRLNAANGIPDLVHALYARNDTAYLSASNQGLVVGRFTPSNQFQIIGGLPTYPQQGYNHSSWLNNANIGVMIDETHGMAMKVISSDQLPAIQVLSLFSPCSGDTCVPHNTFMKGNIAFIAHYTQGLQIYSLADPTNPVRLGYYDTYPQETTPGGYAGVWGCYPYLSGNKVLVSDMQTGFYVFDAAPALRMAKLSGEAAAVLQVTPNPATDRIEIRVPEITQPGSTVEILEAVSGKLLQQLPVAAGDKTLRVPLPASAPAGLYFVRLISGSTTATVRFLKH